MAIEVIPAGASAVVTDRHHHGHDNHRGYRDDGSILEAIKDAEAQLDRAAGSRFASTLKTIKDTEAQLDRAAGDRYADTVKTVKDSECQLDRDIKDAEARLDRASGDRFIQTIQDVKEVEISNEKAKGRILEAIRESEYRNEKTEAHTRESLLKEFRRDAERDCKNTDNIKDAIQEARRELLYHELNGSKENLLEFKEAQAKMFKLAAEADKTACHNQKETLLQFKEQALISERLAAQASKEMMECCCELKSLIREDGQKTRDLVNLQEVDRLRERASRAEAGLAAYFARNVTPVVPVA